MSLPLRPYQVEAIEAIEAAGNNGSRRPLVVHPTGAGKTVTFSHLIQQRTEQYQRSLVLVHRDELVGQTIDKMNMIAPDLPVGVVKAGRNETDRPVTVASVQTVQRDERLASLGDFSTVIVDEGHHADAPSWTKVLDGLGSFNDGGPLTVGFTATPERDGRKLGFWDQVAHYVSIREMIYAEYLVPATGQTVATSADFDAVAKNRGDLSEGGTGAELERSGAIEEIADAWHEHAADRKTVAFTPTVETAKRLSEAVRARGGAAEAIWGTMPTEERRAVLARLAAGETTFVANCAVLTEGFDEPSVDCILVARPTTFHGLYVQMVGRGLRRHPGKSDCLVLDVTGASQRHDLVAVVDLGISKGAAAEQDEEPTEREQGPPCQLCGRPLSASQVAENRRRHRNCAAEATGKTDVFAASRLRWLPVDQGFVLPMQDGVVVIAPKDESGNLWQLATYDRGNIEMVNPSLPIDWAQGIGEDRAKAFGKLNERDASWLSMRPTERQLSRLTREGLPESKLHRVESRGQAADLITRLAGRRAIRRLTKA